MHYIVFILALMAWPASAEVFKIDDGVRLPKNMVVSGGSVIDDETVDDDIEIPDTISDEEQKKLESGTGEITIQAPGQPTTTVPTPLIEPQEPPKKVKQVIKPYQPLKVRRSIADDRIDDSYVQEMIKDNPLFTPDYKDKRP